MQSNSLLVQNQRNLNFLVLFVAIFFNLVTAVNTVLHDPFVGYDADGHLDYMVVAARHLPDEAESGEYFSPPFP